MGLLDVLFSPQLTASERMANLSPEDRAKAEVANAQMAGGMQDRMQNPIGPTTPTAANAAMVNRMQNPQMGFPLALPYEHQQPARGAPVRSPTGIFNPATAAPLGQGTVFDPTVTPVDITDQPPPDINSPDAAQQPQGGLLQQLAGAAQDAVQSPDASKGLLSQLGDTLSGVGQKLTNLSPNMSQSLIAAGLTMLAGNSGRRNLSELVGMGGIAGMNEYQTLTQNQIANKMAQQKMAQEWYEKQQQRQIELARPVQLEPGKPFTTVADILAGRQPVSTGQLPTTTWKPTVNEQGVKGDVGLDMFGKPTGAFVPAAEQLTPDERKLVNDAQTTASNNQFNFQRTQDILGKLSKTIRDPVTGQEKPNPNYESLGAGGVVRDVYRGLLGLSGDVPLGEPLRQHINAQIQAAGMQTFKGVGRFSNLDMGVLLKNIPANNASEEQWTKWFKDYAEIQQASAIQSAAHAAYLDANHGDAGSLKYPLQFNGRTYKPGEATLAKVTADATFGPPKKLEGKQAPAAAPAATPAAPTAAAPGAGRTIMIGGKEYTQDQVQAAIARKQAGRG